MDPPKLDAGSFEFYEGIRILIPGAAVVTAYAAVVATFHLHAPDPSADVLAAIAATVTAGLVLYFIDAPAKAQAFSADELPHVHLAKLDVPRPERMSSQSFYFVLLDELVPAPIRARALYMGSMYRIGFELIYILFLSSVGILVVSVMGVDSPMRDSDRSYIVFGIGIILSLLLVPAAVYSGYVRIGRRKGSAAQSKGKALWTQFRHQIPGPDRVLLVVAAGFVAWFCVSARHPRALFAIAVGLPETAALAAGFGVGMGVAFA